MARSPNVRMPGEAPASAAADPVEVADAPSAAAGDGLPDAASIDPRTLRKAVMTRQGWLCPVPPPDDGPQRRQGFAV